MSVPGIELGTRVEGLGFKVLSLGRHVTKLYRANLIKPFGINFRRRKISSSR